MKIRDSGMPEEPTWAQFFDPLDALRRLGLRLGSRDIADMGCGYGTFSVAAAQLTSGIVHAYDIEPDMLAATRANAERHSIKNVRVTLRDFVREGTDLRDGSVGYVMLFNILHAEDPMVLLQEAFRILGRGSTLAIMHWISDTPTPRGPPLNIRPSPEQCLDWLGAAGFEISSQMVELPPYHFGLTARKPTADNRGLSSWRARTQIGE
jgi:SAM-dependent methyltransferase